MTTTIDEVADATFRISTYLADAGLCFNQYLLLADEPLLFHTGHRTLFDDVRAAVARVLAPEDLRWIAWGHLEADESGSANRWLALAPRAQVLAGHLANAVSLNDACDRAPVGIGDGETIDLGGRVVRHVDTPHVPHGWDARLLYDETTRTMLCGDLFTALGEQPPTTDADVVEPAIAAEDAFGATCLTPTTGSTIRALADLSATSLALMHGPFFTGDAGAALRALGDHYDERHARAQA